MPDSAKSRQPALDVLSESQMYRDYERAFTQGTPVRVIYHSPFFGEPFVTKIVLGGAAAN